MTPSSSLSRLGTHLRSTESALRGEGRGWVLLAVATGWLLTLGMRFVVPALLPRIKAEFALSNTTAGIAVTVVWITYAFMQFPAGAIVDRIGEHLLLTSSLVLAAGSVLAFGVAPAFGAFLLACAAFGFGTGLYGPPRATVLSKTYPENDGVAFGITLAAGSLGAAAVPFLATFMSTRFGWRAAIGAFAPFFLLTSVLMWRTVPRRDSGIVRVTGSDLDAASLWRGTRAVIAGISRRPVVLAVGAAMVMLFTFQALTAFLPTYLVATKGVSPASAAGLYALLFISGSAFQPIAGSAADRFGDREVSAFVAGVSVLPLVGVVLVEGPLALAVLIALIGARLGTDPILNAYVVRALPPGIQGTAWGLLRTVFFTVASTGSVVVGVLGDAGWFDEAFFLLAALTVFAALLCAGLPSRSALA